MNWNTFGFIITGTGTTTKLGGVFNYFLIFYLICFPPDFSVLKIN
jgi:hypothetical protein